MADEREAWCPRTGACDAPLCALGAEVRPVDDYARLRSAVAALADQWEAERYPGTGDPGWNQGYDTRRESDADALRALLIPPGGSDA